VSAARKTPIAYRPFTMVSGLLAGVVANAAFKALWTRVAADSRVPDPGDPLETWGRLLLAATLEGVTFAVVKVTADRVAAGVFNRASGSWPGQGTAAS